MKKIIYIDMDDVLCQFSTAHAAKKAEFPEMAYPQNQYGFFRKLQPIPNAIESFHQLFNDARFDVYILSSPSVWNPLSYSEKREWIENHLGFEFCERLILSPQKHLNKGDYLIDDKSEGRGQDKFEGELILFGQAPFENWTKVLTYLNQKHA